MVWMVWDVVAHRSSQLPEEALKTIIDLALIQPNLWPKTSWVPFRGGFQRWRWWWCIIIISQSSVSISYLCWNVGHHIIIELPWIKTRCGDCLTALCEHTGTHWHVLVSCYTHESLLCFCLKSSEPFGAPCWKWLSAFYLETVATSGQFVKPGFLGKSHLKVQCVRVGLIYDFWKCYILTYCQ